MNRIAILLAIALALISCQERKSNTKGDWLSSGTNDERFEKVSKHLRGLDMAMVEVGYRYIELFWAGRDQNWEYAKYQTDKIELAIKNGIERRPKRAESAQMIFPIINDLRATISESDLQKFNKGFEQLTVTCNACRQAEKVSFFKIAPPLHRPSSVSSSMDTSAQKKKRQ